MDFAFEFIIKNGGIDTEEDYPYTVRGGERWGALGKAGRGRRGQPWRWVGGQRGLCSAAAVVRLGAPLLPPLTSPRSLRRALQAEEGQCQENKLGRHVVTIDDYQARPRCCCALNNNAAAAALLCCSAGCCAEARRPGNRQRARLRGSPRAPTQARNGACSRLNPPAPARLPPAGRAAQRRKGAGEGGGAPAGVGGHRGRPGALGRGRCARPGCWGSLRAGAWRRACCAAAAGWQALGCGWRVLLVASRHLTRPLPRPPLPPCRAQRAFQLYVGGVFDAECGTALDHGVLAVG